MYASRQRLLTRSRRRAGRVRARRTRRKTMVRASRKRRQRDSVCLPAQPSSIRCHLAAPSQLSPVAACAPPPATRQITINGMLEGCAESRNEPLRGRHRRCYPPAAFSRRPTRSGPASPSRPSALTTSRVCRLSRYRPGRATASTGSGSPHLWMGVWICRLRRVQGSQRVCRTLSAHCRHPEDSIAGKG